jgi:hypothetical protein
MPRATWSGFLRLALVSCPIYLSPATTRTKSIRLHQVWQPAAATEREAGEPDRDRDTLAPTRQDRSQRNHNRPPEPIKAAQPLGLRCARMTQGPARRSRNRKSLKDMNTIAANSSRFPRRS